MMCPPLPTLASISSTESFVLTPGLTLSPRIKLLLSIHRHNASVSPLDEWKLKQSLLDFLKKSFSHPIIVPEEDLRIRRCRDINKRKPEQPVAVGSIVLRNLGFVVASAKQVKAFQGEKEKENEDVIDNKLVEWRKGIVEKMDGMEVNLEGVKFRVKVSSPKVDDLQEMKKEWEEFFAFGQGLEFWVQ